MNALLQYYPGQYMTLINPDGVARSYSTANNLSLDGYMEFHISLAKDGQFSGWLFSTAETGDTIHLRGPLGDCFYSNTSNESFPILLAGTGTGLAPLFGIINDALDQEHQGNIMLFHGGRSIEQLYYIEELKALAEKHPQLQYFPCTKESSEIENEFTGTLEDVIAANTDPSDLSRMRIYLCGGPDTVNSLRKTLFLKGAASSRIFCDPFLERKS